MMGFPDYGRLVITTEVLSKVVRCPPSGALDGSDRPRSLAQPAHTWNPTQGSTKNTVLIKGLLSDTMLDSAPPTMFFEDTPRTTCG